MIIGRDYIKNKDLGMRIGMGIFRFIPSEYLVKISSILMVKKNDVVYEVKNRWYVDDIKSKDILEEMSKADFRVISKKDFINPITCERMFNFKNEHEFVDKLIEPLDNKFILFDCDIA